MSSPVSPRRVVIVAGADERPGLRALFSQPGLRAWQPVESGEAVLVGGADVVLLDAAAMPAGLPARVDVPVVVLSEGPPAGGAWHWVPRQLALAHPPLLEAALGQALGQAELLRRQRELEQALAESREQAARLSDLLWEAVPTEGRPGWFTQRYMLERLYAEVVRCGRYGSIVAVGLLEVEMGPTRDIPERENPPGQQGILRRLIERVVGARRRSDVAGQYGPQGFMLLMPQTPLTGAIACCRRLRGLLEDMGEHEKVPLRVWFGTATYSPSSATPQRLLRLAEERLEQSRHGAK